MTPGAQQLTAEEIRAAVEKEVGRVAPGLAADLIAVAGNPAERVQALEAVRLVLVNGNAAVNRLERSRLP